MNTIQIESNEITATGLKSVLERLLRQERITENDDIYSSPHGNFIVGGGWMDHPSKTYMRVGEVRDHVEEYHTSLKA